MALFFVWNGGESRISAEYLVGQRKPGYWRNHAQFNAARVNLIKNPILDKDSVARLNGIGVKRREN
jgi:hypothetical protein